MVTRSRLLLVMFVGLWSLQARAQEPTTIGVMDFAVTKGTSREIADSMAALLVKEIESLGLVRVVGQAELKALLKAARQESLVDFEWKCPAEGYHEMLKGGEPAVRWVVAGQVARFGALYVLNLKLFDLKSRTVAGRVVRRIRGGPEEFPDELSDATQMLFEEAADRVGVEIIAKTVVTAARHRQLIEESPSAVTVITREDIEASGADSLPNLLRLVPGMDVIVSSGLFQTIGSRLQWSNEGQQYLALIDGREINIDQLGFPVWESEPIFLEDIERIEVIRGPGSALYGANAFGGVVSIITRGISDKASAGILLNTGEAGRTRAALRASTKLGDWGFAVSGGGDLAGQFVDPRESSKQVWKARALVERRWSESKRILLDAGLAFIEGPFATPMGTVQAESDSMSLRLAYESDDLRAQLYWYHLNTQWQIDTPLEYAGMRLADFVAANPLGHIIDAQLQWTPPCFWEPLMLIVGGGARASSMSGDDMLDAETFPDPASPDYRQPGIQHWEMRAGAFVHAEYAPADWVTVTGGARLDYDTQTEWFISPRLAAVFQLAANHYLRAAVARSFRKPSFIETVGHLMVEFPEESPIQGTAQDEFQEFMTRVGAYRGLDNEELLAFEAGYVAGFLEDQLKIGLDFYYNRYRNQTRLISHIVEDQQGLPDLQESSFMFSNEGPDIDTIGCELSVRYSPSRNLSFLASWSHRQVYDYSIGGFSDEAPKNLITLGGRFRTESGLVGSLYAFARSDVVDRYIENPAGILQPNLQLHMDNVVLLIGKLGRRFELNQRIQIEIGLKLFLPISPFSAPHFRYYEAGGGTTPTGKRYGAEQLGRMLTGYLEGSF
jgi:iron complex outermembrane receptor protein